MKSIAKKMIEIVFGDIKGSKGSFELFIDTLAIISFSIAVFNDRIKESFLNINQFYSYSISSFIESYLIIFLGVWYIFLTITLIAVLIEVVLEVLIHKNDDFSPAIIHAHAIKDQIAINATMWSYSILLLRANSILIPFWLVTVSFLYNTPEEYIYNPYLFFSHLGLFVSCVYIIGASRIGRLRMLFIIEGEETNLSKIFLVVIFLLSVIFWIYSFPILL